MIKSILQLDQYVDYDISDLRLQYKSIVENNQGVHLWSKYGGTIRYDLSEYQYGPCQDLFKQLDFKYNLPEQDRSPAIHVFPKDSKLPIHKDPDSYAWIAVVLEGDQALGFYNEDKQLLEIVKYKIELTNSKHPHQPITDGRERVLLRKVYLETPYETLVQCFN